MKKIIIETLEWILFIAVITCINFLCNGCKTTKTISDHATTVQKVNTRQVPVTVEDSIAVAGIHLHIDSLTVGVDSATGKATMPAKTIRKGNVTAKASVMNGKLSIEVTSPDSTYHTKKTVQVQVHDTITATTHTIVQERKPNMLGKIWSNARNIPGVVMAIVSISLCVILFKRDKA